MLSLQHSRLESNTLHFKDDYTAAKIIQHVTFSESVE